MGCGLQLGIYSFKIWEEIFLVHKRKMPLKFGQVWMHLEHLDAFGHIWTGFGQVRIGFGRVWKGFGGLWRSLEEFDQVLN